jgi:hypothetical protein
VMRMLPTSLFPGVSFRVLRELRLLLLSHLHPQVRKPRAPAPPRLLRLRALALPTIRMSWPSKLLLPVPPPRTSAGVSPM